MARTKVVEGSKYIRIFTQTLKDAQTWKKKVWKIMGSPTGEKSSYRLCFTSAPKTAINEYVKEGWKRSELKAVEVK